MSDRGGSGSIRNQQQSLQDLGRLLLAFLNNTRSNSPENHYEDIVRRISQHRPAISSSMSDVRSLIPHFMPPSVPSTPTPIKRSEAEEAFDIRQRAYVFIDHLDNKEWDALLGMMTRNIKVPKTECRLIPNLSNKVSFNFAEEPASEYVEYLKSSEGLGTKDSRLVTSHQLGASFITLVSSSEKHAHFQTKIDQMRYANRQCGAEFPNARFEARANAVMEMTLIFKKEEGEWKVSGMAGFIRWIEFFKPTVFIGTNHPEKDPYRKKIVENTLRYHRLLPVSKKGTKSSAQQQVQRYDPQSSHGFMSHSRHDDYLGSGYQSGYSGDQWPPYRR